MELSRDFKGVFIPKDIWLNDDLSITEKAIYAEIDSLDGADGCFASNEYLAEFCKVSASTITRTISKLISMGLLESSSFNGRTRVLRVVKMTSLPSQIDESDLSNSSVSSIKEKNKIIYNREGQDKPVSTSNSKHSRSFRKDVETLSDDLASQQEIQAQKKERKKQSNYDKCLAYIDELNYSDEIKDLLRRFFIQSYNSNASERVSDVKRLQSRIKKLDKFIANKEDPAKIIQQSIDLEWHSFWSVKDSTTTKRKSFEGLADSVVSTLSSEERQKKMDEKRRLVAEGKLKVY